MNVISWIIEHIYILAVVGFALFSFLAKFVKMPEQKGTPAGNMPTFGGAGPDKERTQRRAEQNHNGPGEIQRRFSHEERTTVEARSSRPTTMPAPSPMERRVEETSIFEENMTADSLEERIRAMEDERRNVLERLDQITQTHSHGHSHHNADSTEEKITSVSQNRFDTKDIRNGVLWSEILGPPRSKRPYGRTR